MERRALIFSALGSALPGQTQHVLRLRRRDDTKAIEFTEPIDARRSAVILCDMWDRHWCEGANGRVALLVKRCGPLLEKARASGMLIIHAPSETMDFYADAPQRKAMLALPRVDPPKPLDLTAPALPIDDSNGGCDTPGDEQHKAWSRQHAGIVVGPEDLISDQGTEVYSALRARGIQRLFVMGVHTNMCILNRTFAIKQMSKWGVQCVLLRDMTDAMYNPRDRPHVSHARGTELVIEYIERYWCPSTTSDELLKALG
ncbi:cysteine hydrolase family protein [uncultured Paludibaculum sp.]|uniref:cysteine hydrolase family protein n=1 Tax=uncultured Paludibaculum sp. TaxID=1765020 RepID=UPI002AAB6E68|nr:cysteine hydrolase family protein [uncultured Paludibaculum sp.]